MEQLSHFKALLKIKAIEPLSTTNKRVTFCFHFVFCTGIWSMNYPSTNTEFGLINNSSYTMLSMVHVTLHQFYHIFHNCFCNSTLSLSWKNWTVYRTSMMQVKNFSTIRKYFTVRFTSLYFVDMIYGSWRRRISGCQSLKGFPSITDLCRQLIFFYLWRSRRYIEYKSALRNKTVAWLCSKSCLIVMNLQKSRPTDRQTDDKVIPICRSFYQL